MTEAPLVPGRQLGPYRLDRKVALGGMAEIWAAERVDGADGARTVALKVMLAEHSRNPQFRHMFWDESNIAQRLQHANIVRVFDGQALDGHLVQVLELVDGVDIRRLLSRLSQSREWFPTPYALMVIRDVARGLSYAHNRRTPEGQPMNIVHRDISPHNVMVTRDGTGKVLDFGIARAEERQARTKTGVIKGKLAYMAPEQALGTRVDARTDIFAAGVVLWEMLAMQRLFRHDNETETLQRLVQADIKDIRHINSSVPDDAAEVLHRMLAASPRHRPDSMSWVENQLNRALAIHYSAEQSSAAALEAWLAPKLDGALGAGGGRRKTMVLAESGESSVTESDRPRSTVTDPSAPTDPDDGDVAATHVDLTPPDFD